MKNKLHFELSLESPNWNFLMVCGQKRKFFLTMKKKEVRDLINESMMEEKYQQKIGAF